MSRLFISLYVAITLGLLSIGWATEQLWQNLQNSNDDEFSAVIQLSKTVPLLLHQQQFTTETLSELVSLPVTLFTNEEISFSHQHMAVLSSSEPLVLYNENNQMLIVLKQINQQGYIQLGPIHPTESNNLLKISLLFFSYLLLAGIIFLWTRPLWRDLNKLQLAAIAYGQGNFSTRSHVSKSSAISPLATTFNAMSLQISRLINEQKQLINAVSHDLRTPLSRLKFSLAMQQTSEQTKDMSLDVQELEHLIDELLRFGRLESQHQQLNIDNVNFNQLISHLTEKLSRNLINTTIHLNLANNINWPCDGHLIERAIQNLIVNAIRYGDKHITVSLSINDKHCIIAVEDDGQGIAKEDRDKVFNAFTRLEKSRNKAKGGFGLGLAIVQRICQWHQGTCSVEDSALGGAKFTLSIPCISADKKQLMTNG